MKKLTAILAILLIATPCIAGSVKLMNYHGDSWVVGTASGDGTFSTVVSLDNMPDSFAPVHPARNEKAWKWLGDTVAYDTTGTVVPPDPSEAISKMETMLIDAYVDTGAEYPEIEAMALLDRYPSVERQLERKRYQITIDYIRQKIEPNEDIVSDTIVAEFEDYLKIN